VVQFTIILLKALFVFITTRFILLYAIIKQNKQTFWRDIK